jgi:hypothetical protein
MVPRAHGSALSAVSGESTRVQQLASAVYRVLSTSESLRQLRCLNLCAMHVLKLGKFVFRKLIIQIKIWLHHSDPYVKIFEIRSHSPTFEKYFLKYYFILNIFLEYFFILRTFNFIFGVLCFIFKQSPYDEHCYIYLAIL